MIQPVLLDSQPVNVTMHFCLFASNNLHISKKTIKSSLVAPRVASLGPKQPLSFRGH